MNLDLEEFSVINIDSKIKFFELYININTQKKASSYFEKPFYISNRALKFKINNLNKMLQNNKRKTL